jgi:hypothetical protein
MLRAEQVFQGEPDGLRDVLRGVASVAPQPDAAAGLLADVQPVAVVVALTRAN